MSASGVRTEFPREAHLEGTAVVLQRAGTRAMGHLNPFQVIGQLSNGKIQGG